MIPMNPRASMRDRAPNDFVEEALWGPDAKNNAIVSVAFAGNAKGLAPQLLVAKTWSDRSVVFEARPLTSPPFAANRFTYTIESPSTLKMVWEVERKDGWSVGDHISCNRTPKASDGCGGPFQERPSDGLRLSTGGTFTRRPITRRKNVE
jgi:hypothetical protein